MSKSIFLLLTLLSFSCNADDSSDSKASIHNHYKTVGDIPSPAGFTRSVADSASFAIWLRNVSLKSDNHVYLYNGELKRNQTAQFTVLNISVGKTDLQQCADAVIRLRAEYLFSQKKYDQIVFQDNNGKLYQWTGGSDRKQFDKYLENVFAWCGTASLEKQLNPVRNLKQMQIGDVFIRGGFPGHAMIVIDMAENNSGEKVYMLAQSYMPAQDIHIVKDPTNEVLSPWYKVNNEYKIITPEYEFYRNQLKRW